MGSTNDSRSSDLPPSQGGKYGGFGSGGSYNPSDAMSSRALPSVDDFRDDPVGALGRGWGVFGAALRTASKTINECASPLLLFPLQSTTDVELGIFLKNDLERSFNRHSNAPPTLLFSPPSLLISIPLLRLCRTPLELVGLRSLRGYLPVGITFGAI